MCQTFLSSAASQTAGGGKDGANLFDSRDGMAEGGRDLAFQPHAYSQRKYAYEAAHIHAKHFERHQRFIQSPFMPDEVDEAGDVTSTFGLGQAMLER